MEKLCHQSSFHNVAGRETESQHEINVDTCIPATLLKHAQACKRNIHEVPRDDNSLFSALADQLTDATFTGQSLRDKTEAFISGRRPSEQKESLMLSNPNSRQDTGPTIQDAADFLRHPIVLYRDDDNPPFFFQPNDGHDPIFQILHIGCINNKYYVSFRPHDYIKGQGASVLGYTDSYEDGSDTESENPRALISIGDENKTTIVAPGDAERPISLTVINRGNNNRVALNIIVSENFYEYAERMIANESSVGDEGIHMKIRTSGIGQEEIDRAERNVIEHKIKIQDNINAIIRSDGVELSTLGLGCLLMCFRPKSWLNCRAFIMGLRLHNEKYLDIFRQLLTAFQHINDSNNLTMDVKISIGQLSEGTNLSDCISWTELKNISQGRDMDKTPQPFEKKDVGKKETTTDPRSGRSVGKDDTLSLKVVVRPIGDKSSLSSTDLEKVAVRTAEQVLEADVPYIPHTKTRDRMTTKGSKRNVKSASGSKRKFESDTSLLGADKEHRQSLDAHKRMRSRSKTKVESVRPYKLYQLRDDSSKSRSSLSDADKKLRSLLTENLSVAERREFPRLQSLSINDPDIDEALNTMKGHVVAIYSGEKQLGTAFLLGSPACTMTAGHVIGGSKGNYLQVKNELLSVETRPIGTSSILDVGVLLIKPTIFDKMPNLVDPEIDFSTESCTYIYVVGYVDGNMSPQAEKCPVLPPRDKDDGYIRFQSKMFHQGSSGSPCLVFKNGKFVFKGILVGREEGTGEGTDMPYELIAITFRCIWKRLGLP